MSNLPASSEEDSYEYSGSASDEDFKFDISSNEDYYEEDTIDYLTPIIIPEDAVKECDQIVNIEIPSLELLSKDHDIELEPIYFDRYKITPRFAVDSTPDYSVFCYLSCDEQIILDASLYIPSLERVVFNRYCSFSKNNNSQRLGPALFSASEIPTNSIKDSYFSFHKTPSEKLCRYYFNCVGLFNSGMTCYLNSLIQCLFYLKKFREIVFNCYDSPLEKKSQIVTAMRALFTRMQISYQPVSTRDLTTSFGWDSPDFLFQQHDVQELMKILLSRLDSVTNNKASALFKGKNKVTIVTSQGSTSNEEEFSDLSLTVNGLSTLEESLKKYYEPNMLTGDDQYKLDDGTKCDAEYRTTVIENPTILSLHLRRFEYEKEMIKIYSRFEYNEELEFNGDQYELLSIISHNGSVRGGHYNAFVKIDGHWTNFDDESVRHCETYEALDQNYGNGEKGQFTAYVLFYGKKGVNDISDPEPPQDVIDSEKERLSKTRITIFFDTIENSKDIQVKKDLDPPSFIQVLSKETGIPAEKIVVRDIEDNYNTKVIEEPVPNPKKYLYIDDSPLLPIWVKFWIPNYEIISLGTFHIDPTVDTARILAQQILQKLDMNSTEENKIELDCYLMLEDDFEYVGEAIDKPIDYSCCLLYQFSPETATNETISLFKENLMKKKEEGIFKNAILEDSTLPKYDSHLNLLPEEIQIKTVNDFINYVLNIFNFEFLPFDDPENEERKFVLSLSKRLTFDQLLKCISKKISDENDLIDINRIQLYLPDKFFKGPGHTSLNSEVFNTIETVPDNYECLFFEVLDEDMRFFQRADVTVIDSRGNKIQRLPILFPRGQKNTIGDLHQKLAEIIGHPNFYLYYVKAAAPIFIYSIIDGEIENKENEENKEENKEEKEAEAGAEGEAEAITHKIDYQDNEIQFDYQIFAQIVEKDELMAIKNIPQNEEEEESNFSLDYRVLDDDDILKLRVMRCDQLYTFYNSPNLPFILFTQKGKKWKDIKEMFPNEKIEFMKPTTRSFEPVDAEDDREMVENDVFAIVYNKNLSPFLFGENSLLKIKNEIDELNFEKNFEEEEEEEEAAEEEKAEDEPAGADEEEN